MSDATLSDAIREIFAQANSCEWAAERTRDCAKTFALHDPNHVRQMEAAEEWAARARALKLGGEALQAIAPYTAEVKTLVVQLRSKKPGGHRGKHRANA
jgi:recombinational DNA repair protein RecR